MSQPGSILILANPVSGKGRSLRLAHAVAARLQSAGRVVDLRFTNAAGDARRWASEAAARHADTRPGSILACGGDGTVQEVAHGIAKTAREGLSGPAPALGLIPAGRCNDFARAFGIRRDADEIAEIVLGGIRRPVDLGLVDDRYFCTVATLGIDAEVTSYVDRHHLPFSGTPAYLCSAIKVLMDYEAPVVRIEGDFGTFEGPIFLASSGNTSSYGGAIPITPGADPSDGLLRLCIIRSFPKTQATRLIPATVSGTHGDHPEVSFHDTAGFSVETQTPQEIWADGEYVGSTPCKISIAGNAIELLVPGSGTEIRD